MQLVFAGGCQGDPRAAGPKDKAQDRAKQEGMRDTKEKPRPSTECVVHFQRTYADRLKRFVHDGRPYIRRFAVSRLHSLFTSLEIAVPPYR